MLEFHKTQVGQKFYNVDLPKLIESLIKLSSAIEKQNEINEKLLKENKKSNVLKNKELNESKRP
jgi:hypothetical protein